MNRSPRLLAKIGPVATAPGALIASTPSARAREALLAIPSVAREIPLPDTLADDIAARFLHLAADAPKRRQQNALTVSELQQIRKRLSDSPICFYPFGGADAFYPMLLSNAQISILTGFEPWGRVEDVGRALDLENTGFAICGFSVGGSFDSAGDWYHGAECLGFEHGTLGPLSVIRAVAAQVLNGENVRRLDICAFDLDGDGNLRFSKAKDKNVNHDNVACWLTSATGQRRLYLYRRLSIGDADAGERIDGLHALLSRTSENGQMLQLQKGIPSNLFAHENTQRLLSPSAGLIRAVVCDVRLDAESTSQPVLLRNVTLEQETISLQSVPDSPSGVRPTFGYGSKVFIHRPVDAARDAQRPSE